MKVSAKQLWIAIAVVLVIFIVIGIWFYRKGKKKVTLKEPPKDNPFTGGSGENNPAGVSSSEITSIANALHTEMSGFNWSGHDVAPYQNLNALSDTDFVKVYNTFNTLYQDEGEGTLREWIDSENFAFDDVIESIFERMDRLNLNK